MFVGFSLAKTSLDVGAWCALLEIRVAALPYSCTPELSSITGPKKVQGLSERPNIL